MSEAASYSLVRSQTKRTFADIIEHTIISKHIFTLTPFYTPAVLIFTVKGCNQNIFMMLICVAASYNGTLAVEIRLNTPT